MPQLDSCHPQVVHALEKAGWIVAPKPFVIILDKIHRLHVDIEARKTEENGRQTIMVVEVKYFQDSSAEPDELYAGIGQYLVYRGLLRQQGIDRPLYLAIPVLAYEGVFQRMAMPAIVESRVKMLVVDMDREVIQRWIE